MNVFFLAAGLGTRLRPLTNKLPKPCIPFLNVPLGYYQFRFLQNLNISRCVANTYHLPLQVEALFKTQTLIKNEVLISAETGTVLGSAGGLKQASKLFGNDETILMMNSDEVFFTDNSVFIQEALQQHLRNNNLATLVVMKHPQAGQKFGAIWCDNKSRVQSIMAANTKPEDDLALTPWHYIGAMLLHKNILPLIPDGIETNIFYDVLIKELDHARVEIFKLDSYWYETGNPSDYLAATTALLKGLDTNTIDFINRYDSSHLVQNENGISLVSDSVSVSEDKLRGFNVISKSANTQMLNNLKLIENSIFFENEVLNLSYFS